MDFKTFFVKKIMMSFFVSVSSICIAMALVGMIFEPNTRFGYEAFFSPLIFGVIASFPLLIKYSRSELSLNQMFIRNILHFIFLEMIILLVLFFGGIVTDISALVSISGSILVIDLTVNLVLWMNDRKTAKEFNDALKRMQKDNDLGEQLK